MTPLLLLLVVLLFPTAAYANTGLPMIALTLPSMVIALIPIILIEAVIYRSFVQVPYRRAVAASAAANVTSTIVGIPLSWLLLFLAQVILGVVLGVILPDSQMNAISATAGALFSGGWISPIFINESYWMVPFGSAIGIVGAYPISIWIEQRVAKRFFETSRSVAVRQAVRTANRTTYGLLLALIACWLSRNLVWVQRHQTSSETARHKFFEIAKAQQGPTITPGRAGTGDEYVHETSDGLALIVDASQQPYIYRYIDEQGQPVLTLQGEDGWDFHEGLARASGYVKGSLKCGYIDRTGTHVIPLQFDQCQDFSEGLAAVGVVGEQGRTHGLSDWGYIDKTGQRIIALRFRDVRPFSEGLAPVVVDDRWGYIDKAGNFVIKPTFDNASSFFGGIASVMHVDHLSFTERWSFIDKAGNLQASDSKRSTP
jgi:hypothetical protein